MDIDLQQVFLVLVVIMGTCYAVCAFLSIANRLFFNFEDQEYRATRFENELAKTEDGGNSAVDLLASNPNVMVGSRSELGLSHGSSDQLATGDKNNTRSASTVASVRGAAVNTQWLSYTLQIDKKERLHSPSGLKV
jgi:hypothetical protein